jgi:hypothetical protein
MAADELDPITRKSHLAFQRVETRARSRTRSARVVAYCLGVMTGILITAWLYEPAMMALKDDLRLVSALLVQRNRVQALARPETMERQIGRIRAAKGLPPMPAWRRGGVE